jgi:hypothetical protein
MNPYELQNNIDIVLDEEKRAYAARGRGSGGLGSLNIDLQSVPNNGWTTEGEIPQLLFEKSDPNIISSPNATVLLKLYSSLDEESKNYFVLHLTTHLRKDSPYASIAYFIFFVLYRLEKTVQALEYARKVLAGDSVYGYSNLLGVLSMIVSREYLHIDKKTYGGVKLVLQGNAENNFQLKEKINLALLKHLDRDLSDVNPEINADKEKLLTLWERRFGAGPVANQIKEIDELFNEGEFSQTKYATCISRVRVLIVEIMKHIAEAISLKRQDGKFNVSSGEHATFNYLRDCKFLSDDEWSMIRALYGLASDQGAHQIVALREYARITKNMAYEIALLALTKFTSKTV